METIMEFMRLPWTPERTWSVLIVGAMVIYCIVRVCVGFKQGLRSFEQAHRAARYAEENSEHADQIINAR